MKQLASLIKLISFSISIGFGIACLLNGYWAIEDQHPNAAHILITISMLPIIIAVMKMMRR